MMKYTCDGREVTIEELQVIFDNPYLEEVGEGTQEVNGHIIVAVNK